MADLCPSEIETIWLEMTLPNKHKILISSLCRPPNADIKNFNTNLENLFDNVCSDKEILVLGVLNCDLAAKKPSSDTKELCKLFNIYQFKQLIKDSTRIAENSSTLLDLVFTTDPAKITDSGVIDCSISDSKTRNDRPFVPSDPFSQFHPLALSVHLSPPDLQLLLSMIFVVLL
jgi:hypothetical protein